MTNDTQEVERAQVAEVIPAPGQVSGHLPALVDGDGRQVDLVRDDEWAGVPASLLADDDASSIPRLGVNRKSDGGFVDEDTGEILRAVECVLMDRTHTRALFPLPFGKGDAEPACRSNDGVTPTLESPAQQPGWEVPRDAVGVDVPASSCVECPNARWDGDEPPACMLALELMVGLPDTMAGSVRLARIRFSGMGYGPAKRYWDSFGARLPKRPPIAYVSRITLEPEQTTNGVFLRPRFERVAELTVAQARPLIDERDRRVGEWRDVIATAPVRDDDLSTAPDRSSSGVGEEPF